MTDVSILSIKQSSSTQNIKLNKDELKKDEKTPKIIQKFTADLNNMEEFSKLPRKERRRLTLKAMPSMPSGSYSSGLFSRIHIPNFNTQSLYGYFSSQDIEYLTNLIKSNKLTNRNNLGNIFLFQLFYELQDIHKLPFSDIQKEHFSEFLQSFIRFLFGLEREYISPFLGEIAHEVGLNKELVSLPPVDLKIFWKYFFPKDAFLSEVESFAKDIEISILHGRKNLRKKGLKSGKDSPETIQKAKTLVAKFQSGLALLKKVANHPYGSHLLVGINLTFYEAAQTNNTNSSKEVISCLEQLMSYITCLAGAQRAAYEGDYNFSMTGHVELLKNNESLKKIQDMIANGNKEWKNEIFLFLKAIVDVIKNTDYLLEMFFNSFDIKNDNWRKCIAFEKSLPESEVLEIVLQRFLISRFNKNLYMHILHIIEERVLYVKDEAFTPSVKRAMRIFYLIEQFVSNKFLSLESPAPDVLKLSAENQENIEDTFDNFLKKEIALLLKPLCNVFASGDEIFTEETPARKEFLTIAETVAAMNEARKEFLARDITLEIFSFFPHLETISIAFPENSKILSLVEEIRCNILKTLHSFLQKQDPTLIQNKQSEWEDKIYTYLRRETLPLNCLCLLCDDIRLVLWEKIPNSSWEEPDYLPEPFVNFLLLKGSDEIFSACLLPPIEKKDEKDSKNESKVQELEKVNVTTKTVEKSQSKNSRKRNKNKKKNLNINSLGADNYSQSSSKEKINASPATLKESLKRTKGRTNLILQSLNLLGFSLIRTSGDHEIYGLGGHGEVVVPTSHSTQAPGTAMSIYSQIVNSVGGKREEKKDT